jgi:phosphoribosylaminoimidazolecarboxamide formyltransferase / IMP cyclohydrolase
MAARPIRRALLSVFDKAGLAELARALASRGIELISTGGTARALREAGLEVSDVAAVTGAPEILDGRVKTLHPAIHGGILARLDVAEHARALAGAGIDPIDLVVVNLYPFEASLAAGSSDEGLIEMIDIGGPALIRAAAKNHERVTIMTQPADYAALEDELRTHGGATSPGFRRRQAARAFALTAAYDGAIAAWLAARAGELLPERLVVSGKRRQRTRYGENPHQEGAFYATPGARAGIAGAAQIQGKELSYNNIADADAALELVAELAEPAVAIVKHANPCGAAIGVTTAEAYAKAYACDPLSAYGGIVAVNRRLDRATAEAIAQVFTEVVIAPDADEAAREVLAARPNLRLLLTAAMPDPQARDLVLRSVAGGLLVQERDRQTLSDPELHVVSERAPTEAELTDLRFAFIIAKHVKSNAIVFARHGATVGIGAGQMSRLDSVRIAAQKAAEAALAAGEAEPRTRGSVVASDAFFPFADGLEAALAAGATAAIQPGGSLRDPEVIAAADGARAAMVFTGIRHFRH